MKLSDTAINMLKTFEGLELGAYKCSAGVWTIGYGHTGPEVSDGMTITEPEAEDLLRKDVELFEREVTLLTSDLGLAQHQFDALVSFSFNVGISALKKSTLFKYVSQGDYASAVPEFMKWVNAGGKPVKGLFARRGAEAALFAGRDWREGWDEGIAAFNAR